MCQLSPQSREELLRLRKVWRVSAKAMGTFLLLKPLGRPMDQNTATFHGCLVFDSHAIQDTHKKSPVSGL